MAKDLEDWLDAVYQSGGDREKLDGLYDEWAKGYDQDLWASGNPYIAIMAVAVRGSWGRYWASWATAE